MRFLGLSLSIITSVAVTAHPVLLARDSRGQGTSQDHSVPQQVNQSDSFVTPITKDLVIGMGLGAAGTMAAVWKAKKFGQSSGNKRNEGPPSNDGTSGSGKTRIDRSIGKIKALKQGITRKNPSLSAEEKLVREALSGRGWIKDLLNDIAPEERDIFLRCYKGERESYPGKTWYVNHRENKLHAQASCYQQLVYARQHARIKADYDSRQPQPQPQPNPNEQSPSTEPEPEPKPTPKPEIEKEPNNDRHHQLVHSFKSNSKNLLQQVGSAIHRVQGVPSPVSAPGGGLRGTIIRLPPRIPIGV